MRCMKKLGFLSIAPKRCVVGAQCTVLLKYLHPSKVIADKWPNMSEQDRLGGLLAIRQEIQKVKGREW